MMQSSSLLSSKEKHFNMVVEDFEICVEVERRIMYHACHTSFATRSAVLKVTPAQVCSEELFEFISVVRDFLAIFLKVTINLDSFTAWKYL